MDSTRIKIGQVLYGQKDSSEDVAIVKVESVGIGGINYNDTDNSFQYSFDELFGIPISANVLLSSGFTLSGGLYVHDSISFIKIKQISGSGSGTLTGISASLLNTSMNCKPCMENLLAIHLPLMRTHC